MQGEVDNDRLEAVPLVNSDSELEEWLNSVESKSNREKALPYGFFARNRGFDFSNYEPINVGFGNFKGQTIGTSNRLIRNLMAAENLFRFSAW